MVSGQNEERYLKTEPESVDSIAKDENWERRCGCLKCISYDLCNSTFTGISDLSFPNEQNIQIPITITYDIQCKSTP